MAFGLFAVPFAIGLAAAALGSLPKPRLRSAVVALSLHVGLIALVCSWLAVDKVYSEVHGALYDRALQKELMKGYTQNAHRAALRKFLRNGQLAQAKRYVVEHAPLDVRSKAHLRELFCSARTTPIDAEFLRQLRERSHPTAGDLLSAAASCSRVAVQVVLDAGDVAVGAMDAKGRKALMTGTDVDALALLIQRGAAVNARSADGATALMFHRTPEITRLLLAHGANPRAVDKAGRSALHYGGPPEYLAACFGLILDAGADPNLRDNLPDSRETPLLAMALGRVIADDILLGWFQSAADVLVAHGADPLMYNAAGCSALEYVRLDDPLIATSLRWPALKITGVGGAHLLVAAVRRLDETSIEILLKAGANPTLPDAEGVVAIKLYRAHHSHGKAPEGAFKLLVDTAARLESPAEAPR